MTNHPRRERDEDGEPASAEELAASVPAVQEMAGEMAAQPPQQVPPGFSPNGHAPTARLMEQLPQMLFQAVVAALQQVQVTTAPMPCATCYLARLQWGASHGAEFREADRAYAAAVAGQEAKDPADRIPLDAASFVPEHLRPGGAQAAPPLQPGVVPVGGTFYCAQHMPGGPGMPGQSTLLVAQANLPGLMAEMMRGRAA